MDNSFLENLKEILEPYDDIESSKDGFVFGGYIDWPNLDDYEDFQVKEVMSLLRIDIPFGSSINPFEFYEILKIIQNSEEELYEAICDEAIIIKEDEEVSTEDFINSIMDYEVQIPTVDRLKSSITELFEKYGIPQGLHYEYDEGIPESSKYWPLEMDEDLYFIKKINFNEYKNEIDKIKSKILNEEDELVKKSLMLTIFVLSESYVSSLIVSNLPERDENLIDKGYEKIIQQYISENIRTRKGRKELVKKFYNTDIPAMPHTKLRDALAHEINKVDLKNSRFKYDNSRGNRNENIIEVSIDEIINELEQWFLNLEFP
ncbi:hypothetical protein RNS17_02620 [Staphylococcus pseudintermedius]|uniref:hypothetical protein n=1 Tax=Staphylococcus pseudintermedius TaxID=283734 RepID=UPI0010CF7256|nr:hypothetical protein [Staphylococcus pseudintermedius]MDT0855466.1 hypothetical protein [Staphylococcus pseudintermedius]VTS43722.1 Uncharacterised protein [Staphylococcus pseudintermedius]